MKLNFTLFAAVLATMALVSPPGRPHWNGRINDIDSTDFLFHGSY